MGSGYRDFTAGAPLTADQVDGYLMRQTVMTFASTAARDSALSGVLDEGMAAYIEDIDALTFYSGSAWMQVGPLGQWADYTPTLGASGSNPTLGSGSSAVGAYIRVGRLIIFRATITFGTGGAAGSGTYRVTLPVSARNAFDSIGEAVLNDAGTAFYFQSSIVSPVDAARAEVYSATGAVVTHAVPFAWGTVGDYIKISGSYEAAS